jgi:phage shock protein PspC (stress-responsive transcriptional regulator)
MTTTEMTPPTTPTRRSLRRSRTDRVGAGVAGGLGEYFGVDPVLFRVLFATAAFFGGAGILAYLLAWAAIPEAGTDHARIDDWMGALRRHRVPIWLVAVAAGVLLWVVAFSWWAPARFLPIAIVVILLVALLGRNARRTEVQAPATDPGPTPVNLRKDPGQAPSTAGPSWMQDTRDWINESREARRERMRRAFPVKIATLLVLVATLVTLGLVDAVRGILLPVYFWSALGIIAVGLLVGIALRRAPWSLSVLLIPATIGTVAFAGSEASLHDGVGSRTWVPTSSVSSNYDLAFGSATLDLTSLQPQAGPRTIDMDVGAGKVEIIAPKTLEMTVDANVRFGLVTVDKETADEGSHGAGISRTIVPPRTATGQPITVDVHLADGRITVIRR